MAAYVSHIVSKVCVHLSQWNNIYNVISKHVRVTDIKSLLITLNTVLCCSILDLQHILHEEECNSEEEGWQFLKRTENAEIWRKSDGKSAINLVKVNNCL